MRLRLVVGMVCLSGCATPDVSDLRAYCTPDDAFRIGSESRAYFGVCPKETEAAFLAGLERGRSLERQIIAAGSDAERARLRARLRDAEWWAMHLMTAPGSYGEGH